MQDKIAVIGAGIFGTSIACHLAKKHGTQRAITIWARRKEIAEEIQNSHTNSHYSQSLSLPQHLRATSSLAEAVRGARYIVISVPAQTVRGIVEQLLEHLSIPVVFISLAKGLEKDSLKLMSEVIAEVARKSPVATQITALCGPSFAKDILAERPVGITVGGNRWKTLHEIRDLFDTPLFDVKIVRDLIGVEAGGALKNVFAIMAGMMDGLEMGASIQGDYLTRSIVDMKTIAGFMGAQRATFNGRAGLGDLAITCTKGSRNFRFGQTYVQCYREMQEKDPQEILDETFRRLGTKTVEGFYTLEPLYHFCYKKNMFVPIVSELYQTLYLHQKPPQQAVHDFRIRDKIRSREARLVLSRILNFLFPRLWYRRERGIWARFLDARERQLLERY